MSAHTCAPSSQPTTASFDRFAPQWLAGQLPPESQLLLACWAHCHMPEEALDYISRRFAADEQAYARAPGSGCKTRAASTGGGVSLTASPGWRRVGSSVAQIKRAVFCEGPVVVYVQVTTVCRRMGLPKLPLLPGVSAALAIVLALLLAPMPVLLLLPPPSHLLVLPPPTTADKASFSNADSAITSGAACAGAGQRVFPRLGAASWLLCKTCRLIQALHSTKGVGSG